VDLHLDGEWVATDSSPAVISNLAVRVKRDDGMVVYLEGSEVFRSNMSNDVFVPIGYNDFAGSNTGSEAGAPKPVVRSHAGRGLSMRLASIEQPGLTKRCCVPERLLPRRCSKLAGLE
jgi:hypothetical protein